MCGIAGKLYFNADRMVEPQEISVMTDTLIHRGPDDEGQYIDKNIGLGFRRLSIIDLQTGHQPLSNIDGSVWITFNGEIYNFRELRRSLQRKGYRFMTTSDTEVIIYLYEEYGEQCVNYLRGMFAFVIWDKNKKILFGARDRFGKKPFYYYADREKFVWASEIKAIRAADNITLKPDPFALDYYFAYGYTPAGQSIFTSVKKLEAACYFLLKPFQNNDLTIKRYWEPEFKADESVGENEWTEAIREELAQSVSMRMISDVPLGAFLSGGIDSGSIVALMAKSGPFPVKTFSIGFKEEKYNELAYARTIAKMYNTDHHEMIVEPASIDLLPLLVHAYDEPFADSSAIPTYMVSKFAREYVTVILSGDGGDEIFSGYYSYRKMACMHKTMFSNSVAFRSLFSIANSIMPAYLYGKGLTYYLSKNKNHLGAYFCIWKDYERYKLFNRHFTGMLQNLEKPENFKIALLPDQELEFLGRMQSLDIKTYLVDDILTKVDRVSMLNSLEVRVPLLDHKLAELSFRIPARLKLKDNRQKYIFKKAMQPFLPPEIINRRKQGFEIPLDYWFRDNLKDYAHDVLVNSKYLQDYLDMRYVRQLLDHHQKGMRDFGDKIWSLLFLNEWIRQNTG